MKKTLVLILSILLITILSTKGNSVSAAVIEDLTLLDMGTYQETESVMTRVKVYIDEDMVSFIESTGKTVYTQETRYYILGIYIYSTYKYYFYEDKFVDVVVEEMTLYNDVDSLIYMVSKLEDHANNYSGCDNNETNCVLGYIRSFNRFYDESYTDWLPYVTLREWDALAGTINQGFIDYVDAQDGYGIEFNEFFVQYVSSSDFNADRHTGIPSTYIDRNYKMADPFNSTGEIDVIHMFASMDGIYNQTGASLTFENNDQKDILSWAGDLQHLVRDVMGYLDNNPTMDVSDLPIYTDLGGGYGNVSIDFCDFIGLSSCRFPESDLLADIDAMNIATTFIDNDLNPVSNSLSAYYNIISYDDSYYPNRYKMFQYESVLNELASMNTGTYDTEKFRQEVYILLNVEKTGTNSYDDLYDLLGMTRVQYGLLRGNVVPLGGDMPPLDIRVYVANLFIEYIIDMSSRPYYYYY